MFSFLVSLWGQISTLIPSLASMSPQAKVAAIVALLISVWNSSFLQPYLASLGKAANLVGPFLGVVAAVVAIQPLSWSAVWVGLSGGVLAIPVMALLDAVKVIPGVGSVYVSAINLVEGWLGAPNPEPPPASIMHLARNYKAKVAEFKAKKAA
jgi:hypothetical protein